MILIVMLWLQSILRDFLFLSTFHLLIWVYCETSNLPALDSNVAQKWSNNCINKKCTGYVELIHAVDFWKFHLISCALRNNNNKHPEYHKY